MAFNFIFRDCKSQRGFTLVELSIVLVVIGLLIGGVLAAQSMISTTKINAQVKQIQQFDIATTNFHQKFNRVPGDCNTCSHWSGFEGNGNGHINDISNVSPPTDFWLEPYFFFIDLKNLGEIDTNYQPIVNSFDIGRNKQFPEAAIGRGGLVISGNAFGDLYYTFIYRGSATGERYYADLMAQGNFSSTEALAFDSKLDDSSPTTGNIQATTSTAASSTSAIPFTTETDSSTTCVYNAKYNATISNTNLCRIVVKSLFQ